MPPRTCCLRPRSPFDSLGCLFLSFHSILPLLRVQPARPAAALARVRYVREAAWVVARLARLQPRLWPGHPQLASLPVDDPRHAVPGPGAEHRVLVHGVVLGHRAEQEHQPRLPGREPSLELGRHRLRELLAVVLQRVGRAEVLVLLATPLRVLRVRVREAEQGYARDGQARARLGLLAPLRQDALPPPELLRAPHSRNAFLNISVVAGPT